MFNDDLDPLVDVEVTVDIQAIRFLEDDAGRESRDISNRGVLQLFIKRIQQFFTKRTIDKNTFVKTNGEIPSLYLKVFINNVEFSSNTSEEIVTVIVMYDADTELFIIVIIASGIKTIKIIAKTEFLYFCNLFSIFREI